MVQHAQSDADEAAGRGRASSPDRGWRVGRPFGRSFGRPFEEPVARQEVGRVARARRPAGLAFVPVYFLMVVTVLAAVAVVPPAEGPVAVLVWPGGKAAALVAAEAGGEILRTGAADRVAIVRSADPHFVSRLYAAGAALVAAPGLVAACL